MGADVQEMLRPVGSGSTCGIPRLGSVMKEAVNIGGQKTQHRLSGKYSLGGVGISVAGSLKCQPFKSARVL